jgi:asparagine synthase (glutamine-hydrolysing)
MPSAEPAEPIHAFTFGKPGCDDIRLARDVARTKGASHHVIELDRQNWLVERIPAVWWSDGQFNLLHMHGVESLDQQRNYYRINLNGFLGDAVLGGSYIKPGAPALTDTVDSRGRRFIIEGPALANNFIHTRIPFFANKLMEFTCSLPMSLLAESYIYCKMLLALFPEYYTTIPWQTTGVAISCPKSVEAAFSVLRRVRGKYYRLTGQSSRSTQLFTDYAEWIRQPPACALFEDFMLLSNPLHREYLPKLCAATLWREHVRGQDHSDQLCRILTFELWLQQLYNKAYRPSALT